MLKTGDLILVNVNDGSWGGVEEIFIVDSRGPGAEKTTAHLFTTSCPAVEFDYLCYGDEARIVGKLEIKDLRRAINVVNKKIEPLEKTRVLAETAIEYLKRKNRKERRIAKKPIVGGCSCPDCMADEVAKQTRAKRKNK